MDASAGVEIPHRGDDEVSLINISDSPVPSRTVSPTFSAYPHSRSRTSGTGNIWELYPILHPDRTGQNIKDVGSTGRSFPATASSSADSPTWQDGSFHPPKADTYDTIPSPPSTSSKTASSLSSKKTLSPDAAPYEPVLKVHGIRNGTPASFASRGTEEASEAPTQLEYTPSPPSSPLRYGADDSWGDCGGGYAGRLATHSRQDQVANSPITASAAASFLKQTSNASEMRAPQAQDAKGEARTHSDESPASEEEGGITGERQETQTTSETARDEIDRIINRTLDGVSKAEQLHETRRSPSLDAVPVQSYSEEETGQTSFDFEIKSELSTDYLSESHQDTEHESRSHIPHVTRSPTQADSQGNLEASGVINFLQDRLRAFKSAYNAFAMDWEEDLDRLKRMYGEASSSVDSNTYAQVEVGLEMLNLEVSEQSTIRTRQQPQRYQTGGRDSSEADSGMVYLALRRDLEETTKKLAQMEIHCKLLGDQKDSWDKRDHQLLERYMKVEKECERLKKLHAKTTDHETFVTILLEGDSRLFNSQLIQQGYEGGGRMAEILVERVAELCRFLWGSTSKQLKTFSIQLFLDVEITIKELRQASIIDNSGDFWRFLDGLTDHSALVNVIDAVGRACSDKIKGHIQWYAEIPSCKMIFLAAPQIDPYVDLLDALRRERNLDKLWVARSTPRPESDPFLVLGMDRLYYVDCLFTMPPLRWKTMLGQSAVSRAVTPQPQMHTEPAVLPGHSASPTPTITTVKTVTRAPSPVQSVHADIPKAPWRQQPARPAARGGSLLEQYLESKSMMSATTTSASPKSSVPSPPTTPRDKTRRLATSPTPRRPKAYRRGMVVPVDVAIEGSIGESPPESDEDEPSVELPHSAVQFVQRPVQISSADDDTKSRLSSSRTPSLATRSTSLSSPPGKRMGGWKQRAAMSGNSSTNPNRTPLGARPARVMSIEGAAGRSSDRTFGPK